MEKGNINNNLKIFNNKYEDIYKKIKISIFEKEKWKKETRYDDINEHPRELIDFCEQEVKSFPKDINVLVLGGGTGRESNRIKIEYPNFNLFSLDVSPWGKSIGEEILGDRKDITFIVSDMVEIPFSDNFFSIVFSLHSLEHSPDIDKTMNEVYRVLKNNGLFGLAYPYNWEVDEQHIYKFEDDMEEYMSKFGAVEIGPSKEHQSKLLKINIKKD